MSYVFTPSWIRICSENFEKTVTLHLSKDINIFLRTFRKIFLLLWFILPKKVSYLWNEPCFYLSFSPELPCLEVTYKKTTTIPGITDIQIRQEIPPRQQKSAKIGLIRYLMNGSSPVSVNFLVWCHTFPW